MSRFRIALSKEEKVAVQIGKLLSDFTLDLEAIGRYMAMSNPHLLYVRAITILEATKHNKEIAEYNQIGKYYSDRLQ